MYNHIYSIFKLVIVLHFSRPLKHTSFKNLYAAHANEIEIGTQNGKNTDEKIEIKNHAPSCQTKTRVRSTKQGLALSKFKFGKKRGPRLISITVIRSRALPLCPVTLPLYPYMPELWLDWWRCRNNSQPRSTSEPPLRILINALFYLPWITRPDDKYRYRLRFEIIDTATQLLGILKYYIVYKSYLSYNFLS